jgi:hypothetical protein
VDDPVEDGPERIDLADCAMLLGKSRPLLSVWSKVGKFTLPAGIRDGRSCRTPSRIGAPNCQVGPASAANMASTSSKTST